MLDGLGCWYIRDGICFATFAFSVSHDIPTGTASSTPLIRGLPLQAGGDAKSDYYPTGYFISQIPLVERFGGPETTNKLLAYAYLTIKVNIHTGEPAACICGDGFKAGCSYRGAIAYPIARR